MTSMICEPALCTLQTTVCCLIMLLQTRDNGKPSPLVQAKKHQLQCDNLFPLYQSVPIRKLIQKQTAETISEISGYFV